MIASTGTTIRALINSFVAAVVALFAATATAGVILKIDIANPDEIRFIATDVSSEIDIEGDSGFATAAYGITLKDVLAADPDSLTLLIDGTLSPLDETPYNTVDIVPLSADLDADYPNAINIYYDEGDDEAGAKPQGFTTSRQALAGDSTVITDSGSSYTLKDVSSTGDIVAGYSTTNGGVSEPIGQWEIIDSSDMEQNFDFDGLSYTTVDMPDGEVQVTGRAEGNTDSDINIPDTVSDGTNDYSVTRVGTSAFYDSDLTSVSIGNNVSLINQSAFAINTLTSLTIGNSVARIDRVAFSQNNLRSIIISDSVTTIAQEAFRINELEELIIPKSVTDIGSAAFFSNKLVSVKFEGDFNTNTFSKDIFNDNKSLDTIMYCARTTGWPQDFNNGSTKITTTEIPCSTALDPGLLWLLLRPQVSDDEG